ncbi:MAG: class I SAM-dependent methyltransferase [Chitinophagaceae bacterium]
MVHNNKEVLDYWNQHEVESMYDKYLINLEIELIKENLKPGSKILDAGCGEGEGTVVYASIPDSKIHAVDFSETRLKKAAETLNNVNNVSFKQVDFLGEYKLDNDYDFIVSQRFLINLMEWDLQKKVILDIMNMLKPTGKFLMLEGCIDGVIELNNFRSLYGLEPIPVKWHNLFFENDKLVNFMEENGYKLTKQDGLGDYFLLTRGVRPILDTNLNWDNDFNKISASLEVKDLLRLNTRFSRLKLWCFSKT